MLRDPEALEGVSRRWGPQGGGNLETSPKVPAREKLLRTMSPALWDPASALVHTPVRGGERETQLPPTPEGPFRKEGPNKKLRKVGDEPWDPVFAHLAPQRLSGSRSESAHRGLHGIWAPGPAPARPRPTPPRPRPPGVRGTIWPAPCQGPRLEESGNSGLRVAGKRCVRAR